MIEPSALRALTVLAQAGTVAATAEELGFTPSAVSQQIKRLEAQVGMPLTCRVGRGVVLTPAGESLVTCAQEVFDALERVEQAARSSLAEPQGRLRLVGFSTAIRGLIAPQLAELNRSFPQLRLLIDELDPAQAIGAVAAGTADLAIVHDADGIPTPAPDNLVTRHLHTDIGDVIMCRDHRLATQQRITPADLIGQPWVTSPPGTVCHQWFERLVADQPGAPDVRHHIDDFSTQLAIVSTGQVIALVPRLARPALPDHLVAVPVHPAPRRRVDAAWRTSSAASPAIRAVVAAIA